MNSTREKLPAKTFKDNIDLMLYDFSIENRNDFVANEVNAYGTAYHEKLPRIEVVSQEICRIFLKLINNALYAVNEKSKALSPTPKLRTKKEENQNKPFAAIRASAVKPPSIDLRAKKRVADKGIGIPDSFKEKIVQPFAITKPTGQDTVLRLKWSYDIV